MEVVKYRKSEIDECVSLDSDIKKHNDNAYEVRKQILSGNVAPNSHLTLTQETEFAEKKLFMFNLKSCAEKLEFKKSVDNAILLTDTSIKSEQSVLAKNYKEQYIYIGLGAVIILTGLYIVIKK